MAKKKMIDMVPIWRDRGTNKDMKIELTFSPLVGGDGAGVDSMAFESIDRISLWDVIRVSDTSPNVCRLLFTSESEMPGLNGSILHALGGRETVSSLPTCSSLSMVISCVNSRLPMSHHLVLNLITDISLIWTMSVILRFSPHSEYMCPVLRILYNIIVDQPNIEKCSRKRIDGMLVNSWHPC